MSLATARGKAKVLAETANRVHDLKFHLAEEECQRQEAEEAEKRARERADSLGTLEQLTAVYIKHMKSEGRSSWDKVESA